MTTEGRVTADIEARLRGGCGNCGFVDSTREDAADYIRDLEDELRTARASMGSASASGFRCLECDQRIVRERRPPRDFPPAFSSQYDLRSHELAEHPPSSDRQKEGPR